VGREVRRVPANWKHPTDEAGELIPLHGYNFTDTLNEWLEGSRHWERGLIRDYSRGLDGRDWKPKGDVKSETFEEWHGQKPEAKDYMPEWLPSEATHIQMYETCTEGTPISPVMETPEELARWLADNGASAFGSSTASYEAWLSTIKRGWAPAGIIRPSTGITSGVEGLAGQ
jgi:hypothetical protein